MEITEHEQRRTMSIPIEKVCKDHEQERLLSEHDWYPRLQTYQMLWRTIAQLTCNTSTLVIVRWYSRIFSLIVAWLRSVANVWATIYPFHSSQNSSNVKLSEYNIYLPTKAETKLSTHRNRQGEEDCDRGDGENAHEEEAVRVEAVDTLKHFRRPIGREKLDKHQRAF